MARAARAVGSSLSESMRLTPCAAKYAIAIVDPWDHNAMGACVPSNPTRPSRKAHGYVRGTAYVGAGGTGWILVAPCLANDGVAMWYTAADYGALNTSMTPYASNNLIPGVLTAVTSNLPFTQDNLSLDSISFSTTPVVGRIVSASVSVQYTGTELERSGLTTCYSHPAHENLAGTTFTDFDSRAEASVEAVMRKKCRLSTAGISPDELDYQTFHPNETTAFDYIRMAYPFSKQTQCMNAQSASLGIGAPVMAIKFTGVPGQPFFFEYIVHAEYVGTLADASATPNDTDAVGLSIVQSAFSNLAMAKSSAPDKSLGVLMKAELLKAAKKYGPAALKVGGEMILASLL